MATTTGLSTAAQNISGSEIEQDKEQEMAVIVVFTWSIENTGLDDIAMLSSGKISEESPTRRHMCRRRISAK